MTATQSRTDATDAGRLRLQVDLFDRLAAKQDANTLQERADLIKVDRATLIRWRQGQTEPSLNDAVRVAAILGTRVDRLWQREQVAA